ncbi:MFS transporter [Agromyces tropicus]
MSTATHGHAAAQVVRGVGGGRLTPRRAAATLGAIAFAYAVVMAGTTLPTSLYPALQRAFGLSTAASTQLFAIYAVTVLAGLIAFGSISDRVGRRPVLYLGLSAAIASGILYATASSIPLLFVARAMSGVSAALVTGTATAFLVDSASRPRLGASVASAANMLGLGLGPILAAVVAARFPEQVVSAPFVVHAGLSAIACLALLAAAERPRRLHRRRFEILLPAVPRSALPRFLRASAASVGFVIMGACTAISAILLTAVNGRPDIIVVGAVGSTIFLATAAGQLVGARSGARWRELGFLAIVLGLVGIGSAALVPPSLSIAVLVGGLSLAGVGHGVLFPRALALTIADVAPDRRARASAAYWCVAYAFTAVGAVAVGGLCALWGERTGVPVYAGAMLVVSTAAGIATRGLRAEAG